MNNTAKCENCGQYFFTSEMLATICPVCRKKGVVFDSLPFWDGMLKGFGQKESGGKNED